MDVHINAVFVNEDQLNFGTADTSIEVRNNSLTANTPNVTSSTEDYANEEGFMNVMRSETSGGQLTGIPMLVGTIFQSDQCLDCNTAFVIGTGDYGTVLANNLPLSSTGDFLADWQTLGTSIGASINTFIQSSYSSSTVTVTTPAPSSSAYNSSFQVAATATSSSRCPSPSVALAVGVGAVPQRLRSPPARGRAPFRLTRLVTASITPLRPSWPNHDGAVGYSCCHFHWRSGQRPRRSNVYCYRDD